MTIFIYIEAVLQSYTDLERKLDKSRFELRVPTLYLSLNIHARLIREYMASKDDVFGAAS